MEAVEKVEFAGNLVSYTSWDSLSVECFVDFNSWIKGPGRFGVVEICDTTNVAAQISLILIRVEILYASLLVQTDADIQAICHTKTKVRLLTPERMFWWIILTVLRFGIGHCLSSSRLHHRHLVVEKTVHLR